MTALRPFGLEVKATEGSYHAQVDQRVSPGRPIVLTERGDTVTENALMAAALHPGTTIIRNASSNYMVQDLCFFLQRLGVDVMGIGTTTLTITGRTQIDLDVDYAPSEDPIEAMSLLAAAIVTGSSITIERVPIEFLEIELALLEEMGFQYNHSEEYVARNGHTRLVDLTTHPSVLRAPLDKIHPMPFPGLNIDNLPFFAVIAAVAHGQTLLHDWVYENRAIYLTDLNKLGGKVTLLDPHRVHDRGPEQLLRHGDRSAPRRCARPSCCCSRCWRPRARRCCARRTSSTAATRTSPSASTSSAPTSRRSGTSEPGSRERRARGVGAARSSSPRDRGTRSRQGVSRPAGSPNAARPALSTQRNSVSTHARAGDLGRRRCGHVGGDPWQRCGVVARVAVPVGLRLDQVAELGPLEEHAVAVGALAHLSGSRGSGSPSRCRNGGRSTRPCRDGTPLS